MSIENAIKHAMNGDTTDFKDEIRGVLMDKVRDAVSLERVKTATQLFNNTGQESSDENIQNVDG